ncbi:MAG: 5'/3'-nucleotidase SurE [Alphaproteobacteria bacterium]
MSNDDGINSIGIKILEEELQKTGADITVVAPLGERSGAGHAVTSELTELEHYDSWMRLPRKIERFDERHYAVDGTPADCVNVALSLIMEGRKPDLVITGINIGRNLAEDITYSGTVGAAMEGLIHGVRSIAFSQQIEGRIPDWQIARQYAAPLAEKLIAQSFDINTLISINFPNVPLFRTARHIPRQTRRTPISAKRAPESNLARRLSGNRKNQIVITPLKIDFTDYEALDKLKTLF